MSSHTCWSIGASHWVTSSDKKLSDEFLRPCICQLEFSLNACHCGHSISMDQAMLLMDKAPPVLSPYSKMFYKREAKHIGLNSRVYHNICKQVRWRDSIQPAHFKGTWYFLQESSCSLCRYRIHKSTPDRICSFPKCPWQMLTFELFPSCSQAVFGCKPNEQDHCICWCRFPKFSYVWYMIKCKIIFCHYEVSVVIF